MSMMMMTCEAITPNLKMLINGLFHCKPIPIYKHYQVVIVVTQQQWQNTKLKMMTFYCFYAKDPISTTAHWPVWPGDSSPTPDGHLLQQKSHILMIDQSGLPTVRNPKLTSKKPAQMGRYVRRNL